MLSLHSRMSRLDPATLFLVSTVMGNMAAAADTAEEQQMTLQHLSDAELVHVLSCLGNVYRLSRAVETAGDDGQLGCLQVLASVNRRFRGLIHTQVAKTVLVDCPEGFLLPEDCPSSSDCLIRNCQEICIAPRAAAELRKHQFTKLLSTKATSLISLSIDGGRIRRSQLQLLCTAPWYALSAPSLRTMRSSNYHFRYCAFFRALESLSMQQCSIEVDCATCLISNPPTTLRHLDMRGSVLDDPQTAESSPGRRSHMPPLFFADLPLKAPQLETLVLPPLRYQFPTVRQSRHA